MMDRIKFLEELHGISIVYAVVMGSRAWGYNTDTSDYDIRFIYCRKPEPYLPCCEPDDTITWSKDETEQWHGWDIGKFMSLLMASNASAYEWLETKPLYEHETIASFVRPLLDPCFNRRRLIFHYTNLSNGNYHKYISGKHVVNPKRYFAVVRGITMGHRLVASTEMPSFEIDPHVHPGFERLYNLKITGALPKELGAHYELNEWIQQQIDWLRSRALEIQDLRTVSLKHHCQEAMRGVIYGST